MVIPEILKKADWLNKWGASGDIRPYVYVRPDNMILSPGSRHHLDWFPMEPIFKNPLDTHELEFAEMIYYIEGHAFGPSNMAMPRWVFYDCAILPGFVAGLNFLFLQNTYGVFLLIYQIQCKDHEKMLCN